MKKAFLTVMMLLLIPAVAYATPDLTLDIEGGTYDATTQTWVTSSDDFILNANVNSQGVIGGEDGITLYLCVSLSEDLYYLDANGNVVFNDGTSITIGGDALTASDFAYGLPPLSDTNPDGKGGDLPPHDYFPTAFTEIAFTMDDLGTYQFNISDAAAGIHFDLYTLDGKDKIDDFAPFSHDAGTVPPVPEPSTVALLAGGLLLIPLAAPLRKKTIVH